MHNSMSKSPLVLLVPNITFGLGFGSVYPVNKTTSEQILLQKREGRHRGFRHPIIDWTYSELLQYPDQKNKTFTGERNSGKLWCFGLSSSSGVGAKANLNFISLTHLLFEPRKWIEESKKIKRKHQTEGIKATFFTHFPFLIYFGSFPEFHVTTQAAPKYFPLVSRNLAQLKSGCIINFSFIKSRIVK